MNPTRIADLRASIPSHEEFDCVRAEFDLAVERGLYRLECVARGTMSAVEAFPLTPREMAFLKMIASDVAKLPYWIWKRDNAAA